MVGGAVKLLLDNFEGSFATERRTMEELLKSDLCAERIILATSARVL